ncbi:hypothetical protein L916_13988 [Phytophthora nicotianae]|uniref:Uncharacterized protein n=1 Tax=Phytophthora nicotianae TaxID=4792 RepID=W2IHQ6_PHYNI|nr:hypothetical protein L916_13988 [Phytophthora nicotianae]
MALFVEDSDMSVVEAALSFLDEFDLDVLSPAFESTSHAAQKLAISTKRVASSDTSPSEVKTNDATKRSGMIPERKKVLHAVGVYGNSNRVRNNPRIEILYLKEQLEKLLIDLEVLKKQKEGDVTRTRAARATRDEHPDHDDGVGEHSGQPTTTTEEGRV